ncbi:MAG: lytic transglycosylase domain-containing protein [Candidatus Acidiferrales bacterium]
MRILKAAALLAIFACFFAPGVRAEYAVLRSGQRIHITGYENLGPIIRLHVSGGTVDVAVEDIVNIEPEELFAPTPTPGPAAIALSTERYTELIDAAAKKYGLDGQLLMAVAAAESNFDPRAISRKNAQGVMQLLPTTSARLAVQNPFDPAQSIDAGARYLKELLDRFHGDVRFALAAYNAGPERVDQYGGVPPYRETQDYVAKIIFRVAQHPPQQTQQTAAPQRTAAAPAHKAPEQSQVAGAAGQPAVSSKQSATARTKSTPSRPSFVAVRRF